MAPALSAAAPADPARAAPGEFASVLRLAAPIVAALVAAGLMPVVDSAILAQAGEQALAAASLAGSVLLVFTAGLYGFLSPVGYLAGRAFGAERPADAASCLRAGTRLAIGAGLLCAALMGLVLPLLPFAGQPPGVVARLPAYWVACSAGLVPFAVLVVHHHLLDAIGRPWLPVAVALAMLAVDAVASYALVHGAAGVPPLGLAGAGLGTLLAYGAGLLLYRLAYRVDRNLSPWVAGPRGTEAATARELQAEGTPMGVQYMLECGATALAGLMVGLFGAVALAANQLATSVAMALYMVPLGLAAAVGLRLSQAVGAGRRDSLWPIAWAGLAAVAAWMGGTGLVMALAGGRIAAAFTGDPALTSTAATLFVALGWMQLADGVQSVSLGALRGLLDSRWPTRVSLVCYWLVALPAGALLALVVGVGPAGIWYGFGAGLALAAVLLTLRLRRATRTGATVRPVRQLPASAPRAAAAPRS